MMTGRFCEGALWRFTLTIRYTGALKKPVSLFHSTYQMIPTAYHFSGKN
jgi:hypothetical protein